MKYFALVTFLWLSVAVGAQSIIPLYPEGIPCANELTEEEHMEEHMGRFITSVHAPLLEHYSPVPQIATGGAVMVIPGGGYSIMAWGHEGHDIARHLSVEGLHVFILRHRLPKNERPECRSHVALDDAQRGIQIIRLLADSLGVDREKVAVLGFSAGGHLAASAAIHTLEPDSIAYPAARAFSSRPNLSIPVYPVTIMEDSEAAHRGSINNLLGPKPWDPDLLEHYNLPGQVHALVPPTFLVHAGDDKAVPVENSLRYYSALQRAGVPAELHIYAQGGHGFGSAFQTDLPVRGWIEEMLNWLRGHGFVR
ncbi:alpha/beta hydrolase [Neolewinella aurantiaca]|uniref:Alpha/beta hydrolase n=1 Tax=Neolewinella aurantiaca TaxID=2602767 RepID=A0A5C7FKD9_9BACT|nr:alpha/beta hydrolase [Neolewinella aurantiaca]TXF91818.1 alpha/beta hydrolase [Neolewinella aurantiaca]